MEQDIYILVVLNNYCILKLIDHYLKTSLVKKLTLFTYFRKVGIGK